MNNDHRFRKLLQTLSLRHSVVGLLIVALIAGIIINWPASQRPLVAAASSISYGDGLMVWGQSSNTTPQWRSYGAYSNTFSSMANTVSGGTGTAFVVRTSPIKQEAIAAYVSSGTLRVLCYDGTTWTQEWSDTTLNNAGRRPFDVAYETASGDVMVLYSANVATTNELTYRTKAGSTGCGSANWSGATSLDPTKTSGVVQWVKMAWDRRAGQNLITAIWADANSDLSAMQWSGSAWGNEVSTVLTTSSKLQTVSAAQDVEDFDVEYESLSGDVMVVWGNALGNSTTNGVRYATCTGGTASCTWTLNQTPPTLADDATNLDLSANPQTDEMVFASIGKSGSTLQLAYWSGSAWTGTANVDTTAATPVAGSDLVSTGWLINGATTRSLVVYNDSAATNIGFYTGNGSTFTVQTDQTPTPAFANPQKVYDLAIDPNNSNVGMFYLTDNGSDLFAKQATMDSSGNVTFSNSDSGAALETSVSQVTVGPASFSYWRSKNPAPANLTQRHYIFQQDDGANVNSDSTNGSADTPLTNVKKGERLNVRFQVDNTDAAQPFNNGQYELYYDHNDGGWAKVAFGTPADSSGTGCAVTSWTCTSIDVAAQVGKFNSIAFSPSGQAWVSYFDNSEFLKVAQYVGSGGTGCAVTSWTCTSIDTTGDPPVTRTSIAFSPSGQAWVSYYNKSTGDLRVAQYVGSGGSGCSVATTTWTCTGVDTTGDVGLYASITFSPSGQAWVSYQDTTNADLKVAQYVGTGGTGCAVTSWTCTSVDTTGTVGTNTSIAFSPSGQAWISYYDVTNADLKVAQYVGTGGTGCAVTSWTCTSVDTTGDVGQYTSIAFSPSGQAWISYYDVTNRDLKVAQYGGTGGTGCAVTSWTCTSVDTSSDYGSGSSLTFSATGQPWISYGDVNNFYLRMAQYVGSGGTGCAVTSWTCTSVDTSNNIGGYTSSAMSPSGKLWTSYYDVNSNDLKIANQNRQSEIIPAYGSSGSNGDALTSTAAGTCTGGTTFSNGSWQDGTNTSQPITLAAGKCTEVSFMIDTSQATVGTTYRLALKNKTYNQGLSTYSQYPTFTVVATTSDAIHVSKDNQYQMSACTDTNWGCKDVFTGASTAPYENSSMIDANGNMWVSSFDNWVGDLYVSHFVGSGGSGCTAGITDWSCEKVEHDSGGNIGEYSSIGSNAAGQIWMSYYQRGSGDLRVAKYVGSGGTGCLGTGVTDWTCTTVDSPNDVGGYTSLAFDANGNPWITYFGNLHLRYARYVGSGGNCTSSAWSCDYIDTSGAAGRYTSIRFNSKGTAFVTYTDQTANWVDMAQYVGSGGTGCTGSTAWTCTIVDNPANALGQDLTELTIGTDDSMWVAYRDMTNLDLWAAKYVGTGGTGCTNSTVSGAWSCTKIDATNSQGNNLSIASDGKNNPWISYYDATATALKVARYVGGGLGSGCGGGSSDWYCTTVDNQGTDTGSWTSISFDASGAPWVAETDKTANPWSLKIAKLNYPSTPTSLRYKLDNQGYSYIGTDDTNFDQMAATTNAPMYNFDLVKATNTSNVAPSWIGKSSVAASTDNIKFQVYRFGTTNAWTDLATNSTCTANTDCTISPSAVTTNLSEYYESYGSKYLLHLRVYQVAGSSQTLQTDFITDTTSPSQLVFTNIGRTLSAQYCSGAANSFTVQLQNPAGGAATPNDTTVVQITSSSSGARIFSDSSCNTPITDGNLTYTTSDTSKTFYVLDPTKSAPTWTLTATKTSGPDTLSNGTQTYTVNAATTDTTIKGGVTIRGGSRL